MAAIDWTEIQKKYKGQWVALLDDEETVVGSGATLREAFAEAKKKGHDDPIVMRVPEDVLFVGGWLEHVWKPPPT